MDTLVFDIETQNFFTDPGVGRDNFDALKISVVGAYSYGRDEYFCYEENEMGLLAELFRASSRLVGFSMNHYDVPVLHRYLYAHSGRDPALDLWRKERVDLLQEIEIATGERISLSRLAEANLGVKKDRHSSAAIALWRSRRIAKLKEYCLKDVELTKRLYDLARVNGYLMVPRKNTRELVKVNLSAALRPIQLPLAT